VKTTGNECEAGCSIYADIYNRVQHVKDLLLEEYKPLKGFKASDVDLYYNGQLLSESKMLVEYNFSQAIDEPLDIKFAVNSGMGISLDPTSDPTFVGLVESAMIALIKGKAPRLEEQSTGGTYRLFDPNNEPLAMLKPSDEEAFAPQNPRGNVGICGSPGFMKGTYSATGSSREVAAYLLDHDGFSNVPRTSFAKAKHPNLNNPSGASVWKNGSIQEYVPSAGHAGDYSPNLFSAAAVHRVAILDIRVVNLDRNDGNLLVVSTDQPDGSPRSSLAALQKATLIPIDHGSCLPDAIGATADSIVWMEWPQARLPFGDLELEYINGLDLDRDAALLRDVLNISESCRRVAWAAGRLLQIFANNGRTAYDIGKVLYRDDFDSPSPFEQLLETCTKEASPDQMIEVPDFELLITAYSSPPVAETRISPESAWYSSPPVTHRCVRKPFPMFSRYGAEEEDEKFVTSATPSTRSSSPLFGRLMALDLTDSADFSADDEPRRLSDFAIDQDEKPQKTGQHQFMAELECWSPESTLRFRQSVEDGLQLFLHQHM
jgi:hypothetical protein